jgi:long-chain acyl-CoA synthetase
MHTIGATSVVMRRFDAAEALRIIEHQRITHAQFVPTMFQRILKLPEEVRRRSDLSSLQAVWHAAAPCSIHLKRAMIDLFGPVLWEYYAGSEGGGTIISSAEWLERPGSVGRHWSGGTIRVLDPVALEPVPPGVSGLIYFEPVSIHRFQYHNDPGKTAAAYHEGLFTLGDIGYLDEDGYLFLTDRKSNTIISGGVNIYPQEIEDVLTEHPTVADAAVFGVPDEEFGEQVMAVVELVDASAAGVELAEDLERHCRERLAGFKVPRRLEFTDALPRDSNGKLYKRRLRDQYWEGHESNII